MTRAWTSGTVVWTAVLALPLAGLWLLLARPSLDLEWEHHPAHFWLVLAVALINVALGVVTSDAARQRADGRLFLVSLAFVASAGFLALHALATPGVLLDAPNSGFVVATPIGLLLAAGFAAASSIELSHERSAALMRRSRMAVAALLGAMGAWAAVSLASVPPLDEPLPAERADGWLLGFAIPGIALYALASARYWLLYRRRPARMLLGVITAFALLAEAMFAIAVAPNWHATWWEWHLLMLAAFGLVAVNARREWREERFADLYLAGTAAAEREVSVLFADLQGFTSFSESRSTDEVGEVVDAYARAATPPVQNEAGDVEKLIGDAVMAIFNKRGDQPDHAVRAVRAALTIQRAADRIAAEHADWPRLRVGVNSGRARIGIVGGHGKREHTALGDAVNLASRLEGKAQPGQVVVGAATYLALPDGTTAEPLGGVRVKGKEEAVEAYVVVALPADGRGGDERLQR
jgi:adenylate cyclase